MMHEDTDFIKKQKSKILKEKTRIEQELNVLERFPRYGDQDEDNSDEVDDYYTINEEDRQMLETYKSIKKVLKKISNGTYQTCSNCEKPISRQRLEALPWAYKCLDCENEKK